MGENKYLLSPVQLHGPTTTTAALLAPQHSVNVADPVVGLLCSPRRTHSADPSNVYSTDAKRYRVRGISD